jgi:hypothetical protein
MAPPVERQRRRANKVRDKLLRRRQKYPKVNQDEVSVVSNNTICLKIEQKSRQQSTFELGADNLNRSKADQTSSSIRSLVGNVAASTNLLKTFAGFKAIPEISRAGMAVTPWED